CEILQPQGGMWGVFSRPTDPSDRAADSRRPALEALAEEFQARARAALRAARKDLDVAQIFLRAHGGPENALPVLLARAEAAQARLRPPRTWEHLILVLPRGTAGDTLSDTIATALPGVPTSVVRAQDLFLFCYEAAGGPFHEVARALAGPAEV